jgi:peptide/nickel transport system substrate-binding protein
VAAALVLGALGAVPSYAGAAKSGPTKGGTLTFYGATLRATLDPTSVTGSQGIQSDGLGLLAVYDHLMYVDSADGYTLKMGTAQSMKSDDALVWTLKLKPGIKFTDGTTYDAAAVKSWWEWLATPSSKSTSLTAFANVQSLEVVDPSTLKITLKAPDAVFDRSLADNNAMLVPSPTARTKYGTNYGTSPDTTVGAGPFIVKEFVRDSHLSMDRNPNYYVKGLPYLDHYNYQFLADASTRFAAVQTGQGDAGWDYTYTKAQATSSGLGFKGIPPGGPQWMELNVAVSPFNDPRARQAINLAVDPKQLNQVYYQGLGTVTNTLMATGSSWNPSGVTIPVYNHKKAQDLFNEIAKDKGGPVEFTITISVGTQNLGTTLQAQLASYQNLKVNVNVVPNALYLAELAKKSFQVGFLVSAGGLTGDPEPMLSSFFSSNGSRNYGGLNDASLDAAITKGRSTVNAKEREKVYATAFKSIVDQNDKWFLKLQAPPTPIVFQEKVVSPDALVLGGGCCLMQSAWVKAPK